MIPLIAGLTAATFVSPWAGLAFVVAASGTTFAMAVVDFFTDDDDDDDGDGVEVFA